MAKDVALRDLDQAGFRISNLGEPTEAHDATKTDNLRTPLPLAPVGSPGRSLLAAPADHVHPLPEGLGGSAGVSVHDPSYQLVLGATPELVAELPVDLTPLTGARVAVSFTALVKATSGRGTFHVRVGGDIGSPDGTTLATIEAADLDEWGQITTNAVVDNPRGPQMLKIVAAGSVAAAVAHIRSKHVQLRGA